MQRRAWELAAPERGRIVEESVTLPEAGAVLVEAEWGAVSPGSELLVYRGRVPRSMRLDDSLAALDGGVRYPLRYGYILTGRVSFCGPGVDSDVWLGRRVFTFHPHATHAVVSPDSLLPIPDGIDPMHAPLYANVETALTLHWDASILVGEAVLVTGLGIVGTLVTALAAGSGAGLVVAVEPDADRRAWASAFLRAGGHRSPGTVVELVGSLDEAAEVVAAAPGAYRGTYEGFDVAFEVTGVPSVLDGVLERLAFGGRVVVGSWYGEGTSDLHLGGRFHRSRVRIVSSQVSTLPPPVAGRVDRDRRTRIAWTLLERLDANDLPRREVPFGDLPALFAELASGVRPEPWIAVRY